MKKTLLLLALVLWTGMQAVMAQSKTVRGTVLDENGQPLPAASVKVKGTQAGAITGMDGSFEVTLPEGAENVLIIDAVGYGERTVTVSGDEPLSVRMVISNTTIDDVIITGYGETTKEKYVGAADKIDAKRIEKFPVSDVTKAIEGAAPGIQVTNGGGQPGSGADVRIRGIGSLNGSSAPLYVVDGSPYSGDISSINPSDIQSLVVLKDATATSLYGSRGANGVIVITTKKGKAGEKAQLTIDGSVGFAQRAFPDYKTIKNEKDYYETTWMSYRNALMAAGYDEVSAGEIASGLQPGEGPGVVEYLGGYNSYNVPDNELLDPVTGRLNPNATLKYHDDWAKELSRTGLRQNYALTLSGGSEKTDYYFSAGYLNEEGYTKYSGFERFTSRLNVNSQVNDWLKTGINFSGALITSDFLTNGGTAGGYNPFYASRTNPVVYPVYYYNADGEREIDPLTGDYKYDWGAKNLYPESSIGTRGALPNANVLGSMSLDQDRTYYTSFIAVPYLEIKFLKDFTFHTDVNLTLSNNYTTNYNNKIYGQFAGQGGASSKSNGQGLYYTWKQMLTYGKDFGLHHIDATADHENSSINVNSLSASRAGLAFPGNTNLAGAATPLNSSSVEDNWRMESYLLLANYNYNSKYYLTASVRYDGVSRFSPETRWGSPFWAIGAGWMISKENFMSNITWLDALKIKASFGTTGNQAIGSYYVWQRLYSLDYPNGGDAGAIIAQLGSKDLTWEHDNTFNAGLEFHIAKDRVSGEFNYFRKKVTDMLYLVPMPWSTGIPNRPVNLMDMENKGVELSLNSDVVRSNDFTWNLNLNLTHLKNVITKMPDDDVLDSVIDGNLMYSVGHSRFEYFLVESHVDHETGDELYYYYDENGNKLDTNNYAFANAHGRVYQGSSLPDLTGGFTNSFSYKGFDLSFLFTFGIGGKYYDRIYQDLMSPGSSIGHNWHEDILNSWTPENKDSDLPRVELQNQDIGQNSARWLVDASYLNLRNISLGYTFNSKWAKNIGLQSLKIYATADNIMLLTKRKGMDPQATFDGNPDFIYSPARTIMFGVKVGL